MTSSLAKEPPLLRLVPGTEISKDIRLLAEGMRESRTNLQYINVDKPPRASVLTSSMPGDGSSTTASSLAILLAQAGQRVVLIEADLRKPRVVTLSQLSGDAGLADVLAGRAQADDVIHETGPEGLINGIIAGRIPPNPSEVLGSKRMLDLVDSLKDDYWMLRRWRQ